MSEMKRCINCGGDTYNGVFCSEECEKEFHEKEDEKYSFSDKTLCGKKHGKTICPNCTYITCPYWTRYNEEAYIQLLAEAHEDYMKIVYSEDLDNYIDGGDD